MKTLLFFKHLLATSIRSCMSMRGAFLFEAGLMVANNLIFLLIWWLFFHQFNDIGGWQIGDMALVMTMGMGGYGLTQVCFGKLRDLAQLIINGDLDPYMTQPKNLLLHIAGSRSMARGWGHLATSFILILFGGMFSILPLLLVGILCACLVIASFTAIVNSLAFWIGPMDGLARKFCDSLFLFALYPTNIYSGVMQLVMFTLIPAGIVGYLPVELVRSFTWEKLLILVGSTLFFVGLAFFVFYKGLKKYESGNQFGMR